MAKHVVLVHNGEAEVIYEPQNGAVTLARDLVAREEAA
jgi:hypothetical protein